jgi:4-amino-4-deoxy-L-arabinose transferase-like glycosyltransferase
LKLRKPTLRQTALIGVCAFFFLAGLAIIPLPGVQNDEALFATPLYEPAYDFCYLTVLGHKVPLLIMSYLGTLKTWIYWLVFKIARPSIWSIRLPVLLMGVATLWLFWRVLERLGGLRAAMAGTALLATDAIFLLTTVLDWGPVALQHLLLVGALALALRFHDTGSGRALFAMFLLLGMALWDKALFLWILGGLVVAAAAILPRELWRAFRWRRLALASAGLCLGAAPLIYHNLLKPGDTLRSNASFTLRELGPKSVAVFETLNGRGLLTYLVCEGWMGMPRPPKTALERVAVRVSQIAREPRASVFPWVFLAAVLLLPLARRTRRAALFFLIAFAVAWFQMAVTERAGGSVHHVVLLWPLPHLLVALVAAEMLRPAAMAVIALACGSNLLVLNQYYTQMVRFGSPSVWSDAISTLTTRLRDLRPNHILMMDWGTIDNVRLLSRGRLPIHVGMDAVGKDPPDEADRNLFRRMVDLPNAVFVTYVDSWEQVQGTNRRTAMLAGQLGCTVSVLELVRDRNGRPVFRILRIAPPPTGP